MEIPNPDSRCRAAWSVDVVCWWVVRGERCGCVEVVGQQRAFLRAWDIAKGCDCEGLAWLRSDGDRLARGFEGGRGL